MSERIIDSTGTLGDMRSGTVAGFNILKVEEVAHGMIRKAQGKVEELTLKLTEVEEKYRKRREELAEEYKKRREVLDDELNTLKERTEKELDNLRKEVKEKTEKEAEKKGYQEGFVKGSEEGLKEGREKGRQEALEEMRAKYDMDFEDLKGFLEKAVNELEVKKTSLFREAEHDVLRLAVSIAEKIVKYEIRVSHDSMLNNVKKALSIISEKNSATIQVNPDDVKIIEEHAPEVLDIFRESSSFKIEGNNEVTSGGCVVTSAHGGVDLMIDTQLELVEQALLGEESSDTVPKRKFTPERT